MQANRETPTAHRQRPVRMGASDVVVTYGSEGVVYVRSPHALHSTSGA